MKQILVLISFSFLFMACSVKEEQYHSYDNYLDSDKYSLMFIEFKDNGKLHDKKQQENILNRIEKIDQDVFVFIHGFNHNANMEDEDIKIFKEYLSFMSQGDKKVTGIYIGWRGRQTTWNTLNALSNFNERKDTSKHIGLSDDFKLFMKGLKKVSNDNGNKVITLAHSLGASLMYNSLKKDILKQISSDNLYERSNNLTILLNPAFEALEYFDQVKSLEQKECNIYEEKKTKSCTYKPEMIILSSKNDLKTNRNFKIIRKLTVPIISEQERIRSRKCDMQIHDKYDLNTITVANYKPFQTHKVIAFDKNVSVNTNISNDWLDRAISSSTFKDKEEWQIKLDKLGIKLKHLNNSSNCNPYWIVSMDEDIIKGHRDITDKRLMAFIKSIMELK